MRCVNKDKGAVARKNCQVACIGCGKCFKVCKFDAITIENNLSYIDPDKCRLCTKCVDECPTGAIVKVNFPVRKQKPEAPKQAEPAKTVQGMEADKAAAPKKEAEPLTTNNKEEEAKA